jgi:hypothetical protein
MESPNRSIILNAFVAESAAVQKFISRPNFNVAKSWPGLGRRRAPPWAVIQKSSDQGSLFDGKIDVRKIADARRTKPGQ